jgi:catechol 2,3-dioxygenase-like lactoylglutathione lyase family enzyme
MIRIDHIGIPARARLEAARHLASLGCRQTASPTEASRTIQPTAGPTTPLAERGLYFRTPDGHLFEVMSAPARATP